MEVMHYSREWDNAGMPHAIFFTTRGHSIHGSDHPGLGTPVSHGCVRLTLSNATTLYQLVQANGMSHLIHLASRSRANRRDSGHGSGDHFNFSSSSAIPSRLSRSPVGGSIIAVPNTLDLASSSMRL